MEIREQLSLLELHARQTGMKEAVELIQRLKVGVFTGEIGIKPEHITVDIKTNPVGDIVLSGHITIKSENKILKRDVIGPNQTGSLVKQIEEKTRVQIMEHIYPGRKL